MQVVLTLPNQDKKDYIVEYIKVNQNDKDFKPIKVTDDVKFNKPLDLVEYIGQNSTIFDEKADKESNYHDGFSYHLIETPSLTIYLKKAEWASNGNNDYWKNPEDEKRYNEAEMNGDYDLTKEIWRKRLGVCNSHALVQNHKTNEISLVDFGTRNALLVDFIPYLERVGLNFTDAKIELYNTNSPKINGVERHPLEYRDQFMLRSMSKTEIIEHCVDNYFENEWYQRSNMYDNVPAYIRMLIYKNIDIADELVERGMIKRTLGFDINDNETFYYETLPLENYKISSELKEFKEEYEAIIKRSQLRTQNDKLELDDIAKSQLKELRSQYSQEDWNKNMKELDRMQDFFDQKESKYKNRLKI